MSTIQVLKPKFHIDECLEQVRECLEKGWTGSGFKTAELETKWKEYTGHANACFLNSNTSGLHLAFNILKRHGGWQDGDEVITTPITFVATNHAILYEGLQPVFADVDEYLCMDPVDVEKKITAKTRAIIFVGYGGRVGQLEKILEICKKHDLRLILDAAHMAGTRVHGVTPGCWAGVDVTVYSYQAVKNLPTGKYKFSISTMGGDCGTTDAYAYVKIGGEIVLRADAHFTAYGEWHTSLIKDIDYTAGDEITVGIYVKASGPNAWGKIDDAMLNSVKE